MASLFKGSKGPEIGKLQQDLLEEGHAIPVDELSASFFGAGTDLAVRNYQRSHKGPDRKRLVDDGIVGPSTLWALANPGQSDPRDSYTQPGWSYDPSTAPTELVRALSEAVADIGRKESPDGSNSGPDLAKFNTQGNPWCAFAVSTWLQKLPSGCPFGRIGSVWSIYEWAQKHGAVLEASAKPLPGDLALVLRSDRRGHVGLIVGVAPTGLISTVEGNASNAVRGYVRTRGSLSAIVRPYKR